MKSTKTVIIALVLLVIVSALYRVFPNRPGGFAPQLAMVIFSGALFIKNKKWAFALPLLSMFISDVIYQVLYTSGAITTPGFYSGQWFYYLLLAALVGIGFLIKKINVLNVFLASVAAPTIFFFISNSYVWLTGFGYHHPKTFGGWLATLTDGVPFYRNSLIATLCFSAILFGGYYLVKNFVTKRELATQKVKA